MMMNYDFYEAALAAWSLERATGCLYTGMVSKQVLVGITCTSKLKPNA
jgi:hypothetical protein